ncbi:MAG TPA: CoA transferase [Jatrophihabitantaceae bacterium]|jgi:crotonobetainyl-CoA:carnitine CoA-transferase CaiB-like acyl-CoA transferase
MAGLEQTMSGVTVLDFGMNIAGPHATSLLADLGATVIKVEPPGGETSRTMAPQSDGVSAMVAAMNRNKSYVCLDLRNDASRPVLARLLEHADVVVQNLRPGKSEGLGISAEQCHNVNPRIVHVSVEAFYPAENTRPGYDLLVQAETGMMSLTGDRDRAPSRLPGSLLDHVTGVWGAFGIVAALHGTRDRTAITLTMSDIAMSLLGDRVTAHLLTGEVPTRMGSAIGTTTPLQAYTASDGDVVVGAASNPLFRRFAEVVAPELVDDPEYATQDARIRNRDQLNTLLNERFAKETSATWIRDLDKAGIPNAYIRDLGEATKRHREMSRTGLRAIADLPGMELVANPLLDHDAPPLPHPGGVGADTAAVLASCGFSNDEIAGFVAAGVVVVGEDGAQ